MIWRQIADRLRLSMTEQYVEMHAASAFGFLEGASPNRNKISAHIGAEVAWDFCRRLTPPGWLPHQHLAEPARLALLCESRQGYQNLCQLITQFKLRELTKNDGTATFSDLQQFASGLICLTGGDEGPLASALVTGGESVAREVLEKLMYAFGRENVYVKL